jgi:hypothetical protein
LQTTLFSVGCEKFAIAKHLPVVEEQKDMLFFKKEKEIYKSKTELKMIRKDKKPLIKINKIPFKYF